MFKPNTIGQLQLPTDLEDLIPENHLVRVAHAAIEKMDLEPLLKRYKGGGTSSYHPKMIKHAEYHQRAENEIEQLSLHDVPPAWID